MSWRCFPLVLQGGDSLALAGSFWRRRTRRRPYGRSGLWGYPSVNFPCEIHHKIPPRVPWPKIDGERRGIPVPPTEH